MALTWRGYINLHWTHMLPCNTQRGTNIPPFLFVVFQVKRLPSRGPEHGTTAPIPPANPPVVPQPDAQHDPLQSQLPLQPQPSSQPQLCAHSVPPQSLLYPQQQPHAGPSSGAGEPAAVYSHRGSPLHLSADSACSSSSLPGRDPPREPPTMTQWGENVTRMSPALGWGEWQVSLKQRHCAEVLQGRVGSRQ